MSYETATGRQLGVIKIEGSGLVRIGYIDGKAGALPDKYSGKYTGDKYAIEAIEAFIRETFEVAAEHTKKSKAVNV